MKKGFIDRLQTKIGQIGVMGAYAMMNIDSGKLIGQDWNTLQPVPNDFSTHTLRRLTLDRRTKITEAAASCFVRLGYAETSLDEIVAQSGVVKQTIYNHFANKDAVFKAAIEYLLCNASCDFNQEWFELSPADFLERVGKLQLKQLGDPKTVDFMHLLVKECRRYPELQHVYAESIPKPFVEFVSKYMTEQMSNTAIGRDVELSQAVAWCYRAAMTGFATLSNLAQLIRYPLPNRTDFQHTASVLFARMIESSAVSKVDPQQWSAAPVTQALFTDVSSFFAPQAERFGKKKIVIIEAAIRVFSERGFAEASMDDIAAAAAVSKQTVYKHFRNKQFLFSFICKSAIDQLRSISLPSERLPLPEYVSEFCKVVIDQCKQPWMREYFRLVFGETKSFPMESAGLLIFLMDHGREQLEAKIRESCPQTRVDPLMLSMLVRSIIGGFILLKQIYVLAEHPYLSEETLVLMIQKLVQETF